jgi:hypothetical protein
MADKKQSKSEQKTGNKSKGKDQMDIGNPSVSEDPEQMDPADREVRPRMANPDRMSPPGTKKK